MEEIPDLVSTGVRIIDLLLKDGYPTKSAILIEGSSGGEKDAVAYKFIKSGLEAGDFCIYVTRSSPDEVIQDAKAYDVYLPANEISWKSFQGPGEPYLSQNNLARISFDIKQTLSENGNKKQRVVFDIISPLLLLNATETVYKFLSQLLAEIRMRDSVVLATLQEEMHSSNELSAIELLFDGVLSVRRKENLSVQIQVKKMRGINLSKQCITISWNEFASSSRRETQEVYYSDSIHDRKHIAVLPFVNMSQNQEDSYLADGVTEEIICTLSGISALSVISRTSVMTYKQTSKNLREIGEELGVGSILEGSLRKTGNKTRITAQLIDVANDRHLWARTYEKSMKDIFAIQSEIAYSIADELKVRLTGSETQRQDTKNINAYSMYMKASQLLYGGSKESLNHAVLLLEKAISIDNSFVRAHTALSYAWWQLANNGYYEFDFAAEKAKTAARSALQVGEDYSEAHAAMANVYSLLDRFEDSIREAERAIELNHNIAQAYETLGTEHIVLGHIHEALAASIRAHELDPLSMRACASLALCYQLIGREEAALEILTKLRDVDPKRADTYLWLALLCLPKGNLETAKRFLEEGIGFDPDYKFLRIVLGALYALDGRNIDAERELQMLLDDDNESVRLSAQLVISTAMRNYDQAFSALFKMQENHSWPYHLTLHPLYEDLRKDARYKEFCNRVGIYESKPGVRK